MIAALLVVAGVLLTGAGLGLPLFAIIGLLALACFTGLGPDFAGLSTLDVFTYEAAKLAGRPVLLAIPFFVASGAIMSAGGIAPRLVACARALFGFLPGGLSVASVGACIFFAAISGSSPVTVIAIGSMMYPALVAAGYKRSFSLGLLSSAGSLGILIPPSVPMLVYAIMASGRQPVDVFELFVAGIVPGLLLGLFMAVYSVLRHRGHAREGFRLREVADTLSNGVWAISLPFLIIGGIYSGMFTITEAAAVSVVYALVVEIYIHRALTWRQVGAVLADASVTLGSILIIMALAVVLNLFLIEEMVPNRIVDWIRALDVSAVGFLLALNLCLLVVGAVMDSISAILIIAPLVAPIGHQLGIDPVHLGIIVIVNLEIGYLTPPIGINLFVASSVFRQPMGAVARGVLPFVLMMVVGLGLVTYLPALSMGPVNVLLRDRPFFGERVDERPAVTSPTDGSTRAEKGAAPAIDGAATREAPLEAPAKKRVLTIEEMMNAVEVEAETATGGSL